MVLDKIDRLVVFVEMVRARCATYLLICRVVSCLRGHGSLTCTTFFVWTAEAIDVMLCFESLLALLFLLVLSVIGGDPPRVMGNEHLVKFFLPPLSSLGVSDEIWNMELQLQICLSLALDD